MVTHQRHGGCTAECVASAIADAGRLSLCSCPSQSRSGRLFSVQVGERAMTELQDEIAEESRPSPPAPPPAPSRAAAIIVAVSIAGILGLSLWYLARPQPLLVQGEADASRIDIAARVDGRVA